MVSSALDEARVCSQARSDAERSRREIVGGVVPGRFEGSRGAVARRSPARLLLRRERDYGYGNKKTMSIIFIFLQILIFRYIMHFLCLFFFSHKSETSLLLTALA